MSDLFQVLELTLILALIDCGFWETKEVSVALIEDWVASPMEVSMKGRFCCWC